MINLHRSTVLTAFLTTYQLTSIITSVTALDFTPVDTTTDTKHFDDLINNLLSTAGDVEFRSKGGQPTRPVELSHLQNCAVQFTNGYEMGTLFAKDPSTYELINDGNYSNPIYRPTNTTIIPNEGIILSSGQPTALWNQDSDKYTKDWDSPLGGDGDLFVTANQDELCSSCSSAYAIRDACVLEFDFRCTGGEQYVPEVSFMYIFGSEEYYEYIDSPYNDVFGFYLNGDNIARVTGSTTGSDIVSINNVNYDDNKQYFNGNDPGMSLGDTGNKADPNNAPQYGVIYPTMEADGFTNTLTAYGTVNNGDGWNTIKLAVGDVGDEILDSWVILESASFTCIDKTDAPSMSLAPSPAHSSQPSISTKPSVHPSSSPTLSSMPTVVGTLSPSVSSMPTNAPTDMPSISLAPTHSPSLLPSISSAPSTSSGPSVSSGPSLSSQPSTSSAPSLVASDQPSISSQPSSMPSSNPSTSTSPSVSPTANPSISSAPTESSKPSTSTAPTLSSKPTTSSAPTVSSAPTLSSMPTLSSAPTVSSKPTISSMPTLSVAPTVSSAPTISSAPSTSTVPTESTAPSASPTSSPSVSSAPTDSPSDSPSVSGRPTVEGSLQPSISTAPSDSPTSFPTSNPSESPSSSPTRVATLSPSLSSAPTGAPSDSPTISSAPSNSPSNSPTISSKPTVTASLSPSVSSSPSSSPTASPSVSSAPTDSPTSSPSISSAPTHSPSDSPSTSSKPTITASVSPSVSTSPSSSPTALGSIGPNVVFNDLNQDGIQNENEQSLPNVNVTLYCIGEPADHTSEIYQTWIVIDSVVTNAFGEYEFTSVEPSSCYIQVEPEVNDNDNYVFSPIVEDGNQIYPNGTSPIVDIDYNTNVDDWDFGLYLPLSNVGPNVVFNDLNNDGIQDDNEGPLPGVDITLMCDGQAVETVTTGADGVYEFNDVTPGGCYVQVSPDIAENDSYIFSPIVEDGNQIGPTGTSPVVTIAYNETIDDWDVGLHLPLATVGPAPIFNDANQNGIYDAGESTIPNVPIALICDELEVATTTSNVIGYYEFNNVLPGDCYIQVSVGEDYIISPITTDGNQILSDGTSATVSIGYDDTIDYWEVGMFLPPATIGPNVVFDDENGDGVQDPNEDPLPDVTVDLYCYENGTAVLEGTANTDENGEYTINDIQPGLCYIQVTPPIGDDNVTYVFSPIVPVGNQIFPNSTSPEIELDYNDTIDNLDVGLYLPVTLGNKVWEDMNANGIQDEVDGVMEPGIEGVQVELLNENDEVIDSMLTEPDGSYWFTNLAPAEYGVRFFLPPDYVFAEPLDLLLGDDGGEMPEDYIFADIQPVDPSDWSDVMFDANVDPSTLPTVGAPPHQTLTSGEVNTSFDAGIYRPVLVAGQIFEDLNANGVLDEGEPPLDGAIIFVVSTDSQGNPNPEGTNFVNEVINPASDGTYSIDLPPGTYTATVAPLGDFQLSPLSNPQVVGNDFDPLTYKTVPVVLTSGEDGAGSFDAGFYEPVTISNQVFEDTNSNGVRDPDEEPYVGNITVLLYDPNSDDPDVPIAEVQTDNRGIYTIPNVPPGDYLALFQPEDEDVTFSPQDVGEDDCLDSDADSTGSASVTVTSGDDVLCLGVGVTSLPSIGPNIVFEDMNGNGLQEEGEEGLPGVPVTLYSSDGTEVEVAVTNTDGEYLFTNLQPGEYYITVDKEVDFEWSPQVDGGNQISPETGQSPVITLTTGVDTSLIVGVYEPVLLGNKVWNDLNGDGVQQADEPGMSNIDATLYDGYGVELGATTTDDDGHYLFTDLSPGQYQVKFSIPEEFIFTVQAKNSTEIEDTSNVDPETGKTNIKYLQSGDENYSFDAGMFIPVTIEGETWHDLDANGIEEPNEEGLEGMIITLYDGDGVEIDSTTTGADGTWIFADMPPGTYHVKITPPEDDPWTLSPKPVNSTDTSTDFDPETMETTPTFFEGGSTSEGLFDAGLYLPATIGSYLWFDDVPNGIQDFRELPFDQVVTIQMYDSRASTTVYKTTESDETTGKYLLTGVRPGTYTLKFILPGDNEYQFTLPNAGNDTCVDNDVSPVTDTATVTVVSGEESLCIDGGVMDYGPYYPDWRNDIQVCTNDGFDPAWMLEVQKDNYIYKNKEECCLTHFWWRMTQCMANEEFKFVSDGEKCDTRIFFEDWEDNSPAEWTATTQYDTLQECCATEFFFDYDGCLDESPVMFKFEFCVDIKGLVDPADCQSADIYANVLEDAINTRTHHAHELLGTRGLRALHIDGEDPTVNPPTDTNITRIGGVSLSKADGSTVCGGTLADQDFINALTGTIPDVEAAADSVTEVCGFITVQEQVCNNEECLTEHYNEIAAELANAIDVGELTTEINNHALDRLPPVPELYEVEALAGSLHTENLLLPATVTGDLDWQFYYGGGVTCSEKVVFHAWETPYELLGECCDTHFPNEVEKCCIEGGGCPEKGIAAPDTWYYFNAWVGPDWCGSKATLNNGETASMFFASRAECCDASTQNAEDLADCNDSKA